MKCAQKAEQSVKVYPKPMKGYENGEAPAFYRSVLGQGFVGSAAWRQDRAGDRGEAPASPKPGQHMEAAGYRPDDRCVLWWQAARPNRSGGQRADAKIGRLAVEKD